MVAVKTSSHKTILITGCSSGIGLCTAHGLKNRGHRVFATARKGEDVGRLKQDGLESIQLDLQDSTSIRQAVEAVLEYTGGTLDALFNNGAYGQLGAIEDLSRQSLREQFETNLFGPQELISRILPVMRRQGHGRIIQCSSVLGMVALPFRGAYNASKFALEGLSDTLRLELTDTHIYVSLIEPGPILTRFRKNAYLAFKHNIDRENSVHGKKYATMEKKLQAEGPVTPFTLPPEAVLKQVAHALESTRPKIRYYVTLPTYIFALLRRVLPYRAMDTLILRSK